MGLSLDVRWRYGAEDPERAQEPAFQVHALDEDTYVLRQSMRLNFEAPFLYLLIGASRAFLLDTGAEPVNRGALPLREVVRSILEAWAERRGRRPPPLVVAHSHDHSDHVFADPQFPGDASTLLVGRPLAEVQRFFGLEGWPRRQARFDLGDRELIIIPIPGHDPTHIAFFDPATRILLTGDTFYPGILFVEDWPAFRSSIDRLLEFASSHHVSFILGSHIEMTSRPGEWYPYGSTLQPSEHVLQLSPAHLMKLHEATVRMGDRPRFEVFDDFIIQPMNVPG